MKDKNEDKYYDCDRCGERYWGADISNWLRETDNGRQLCKGDCYEAAVQYRKVK